MFYSFRLVVKISYPTECGVAIRQKIFDGFLLNHTSYCSRVNVTIEATHAARLYFFNEDPQDSQAVLHTKDSTAQKGQTRVLVTYTVHHKNAEQHLIPEISAHMAVCLKRIAELYGGVLVDPTVEQ